LVTSTIMAEGLDFPSRVVELANQPWQGHTRHNGLQG
jgi:hypothetical protein